MDIERIDKIYKHSYQKYDDLYDYFITYCRFQILSTNLFIGFDTFRIRDYNNISDITKKENVQYPKSSTTFSRIGKPGQIWFYISDDLKAAFAEMMPAWFSNILPGQTIKIAVSTWKICLPIEVLIIPDLANINDVCKAIDLSAYKNNIDFWSYICRKFRTTTLEDKHIYKFTSAFANALIDSSKMEEMNVDGIFYPSVQYPLKSNIALLPSVVIDEKIVLKKIFKIDYRKSIEVDTKGKPNYQPLSDFQEGNYNPAKDIISWD